jgi:hypothetical protein
MKKMLALLAVATIPAMFGGCAACWPTGGGLCPCCPCNCFNRPAPCPPAPVCCPPAPTYAAPLAATACPPPCPPPCPPVASQVMPQYVMPSPASFAAAAPCNACQAPMMAPQAMYAQPAYYAEPGCAYIEPGCGGPFMGAVSYGPSMPCECGTCEGGCCGDSAPLSAPVPQAVTPAPGE